MSPGDGGPSRGVDGGSSSYDFGSLLKPVRGLLSVGIVKLCPFGLLEVRGGRSAMIAAPATNSAATAQPIMSARLLRRRMGRGRARSSSGSGGS